MADTKTTLIDGRTCTIEVDYYADGRCHIHTPEELVTQKNK